MRIRNFAGAIRERPHDGRPALRKGYVRHFVERFELDDDEVRIYGSKAALTSGIAKRLPLRPNEVPSSVAPLRLEPVDR